MTFSVLEQKNVGRSGQKDQNCQFKLKFGTKTNLNMRNSMMMFTFTVLEQKFGRNISKLFVQSEI